MASRRPSRSRDELHVEELDEPRNEARTAQRGAPARPAAAADHGTTEATLLQLLGSTGLVIGLGLWLGAGFHTGLAGVANSLGSASLHPGTLAVCGLLLLAFGRVRKAQIQQARNDSSSDDGLLEQVAATQVHTRQALEKLSRSQGEIVEALGFVRGQLQALAEVQAQPGDDAAAQEAIFRLAASLDQLGARVEQRMQAQYETFHAGLEQVGGEIVAAQSDLRAFLTQLPNPAPTPIDPWTEPLPQGGEAGARPQAGVVWRREQPPPSLPSAAAGTHPLGVLDTIPDEAIPAVPFHHPRPVAPPPATPSQGHGEGFQKEAVRSPAERALELDTHTKLTQLSDLLADERLRAALEDMRRNG